MHILTLAHSDRSRNHGLTIGQGRSGPCTASRHEDQRGDDCPPRAIRAAVDRGHGYWIWRYVPFHRSYTHSEWSLIGGTGPLMVSQAVQQYITAGVAGFHIEDQIQNKRCGHLGGKKVVSQDEFLTRIRAAKSTKDRLHSDIVLIARTDALQQHGYEECIRRLRAARDLGADVGLLEGFTSKGQAQQAVDDLRPWPLLLNMVENGAGPVITTKEAQDMGFRIMVFSFASLAPAYLGIKGALERLKKEGIVGTPAGLGPRQLFEVCGLGESMQFDMHAGGVDYCLTL